jgi:hypothetical protein
MACVPLQRAKTAFGGRCQSAWQWLRIWSVLSAFKNGLTFGHAISNDSHSK